MIVAGKTFSAFSSRYWTGAASQATADRAAEPIASGYWCVSNASAAVNEHSAAVNTMKNGSSFRGYTLTCRGTKLRFHICSVY